jgi:hypothetical protein
MENIQNAFNKTALGSVVDRNNSPMVMKMVFEKSEETFRQTGQNYRLSTTLENEQGLITRTMSTTLAVDLCAMNTSAIALSNFHLASSAFLQAYFGPTSSISNGAQNEN